MMHPDVLNEYDDQPYLSPNANPDHKQGDSQYYSPSKINDAKDNSNDVINMDEPYFSPRSGSKQNNTVDSNLEVSPSTLTFDKAKGSCSNCANILVYITGVLNTFIGFFLMSISLGVLIGGSPYKLLGEHFFTAGMSMLLTGGFLVALCSIILMVTVCNRTKPYCKTTLIAACIVLVTIFLLELSAIGLAFWSHSVIASPTGTHGRNAAVDWVLTRRNQFANTTYQACCVAFKPPYSGANATKVDDICAWPESTETIKVHSCSGTDVLVCVCKDGPQQYKYLFNFFLRQCLTYVASTWMIIASLLLAGLITVYAVLCSDRTSNKRSNDYTGMDPHDEASIYAS